jgi:hypothetical protein
MRAEALEAQLPCCLREPQATIREPQATIREPQATIRQPQATIRQPQATNKSAPSKVKIIRAEHSKTSPFNTSECAQGLCSNCETSLCATANFGSK